MPTKLDVLERSIASEAYARRSTKPLYSARASSFAREFPSRASDYWRTPNVPALGGVFLIVMAKLYMLTLWAHSI